MWGRRGCKYFYLWDISKINVSVLIVMQSDLVKETMLHVKKHRSNSFIQYYNSSKIHKINLAFFKVVYNFSSKY